jgi:hypothetical protein
MRIVRREALKLLSALSYNEARRRWPTFMEALA